MNDYENISNYVNKSRIYYDFSLYGKKSTVRDKECQIPLTTTSLEHCSQVDLQS